MRDFRDAKTMAKALREGLAAKSVTLSHSECLELVAQQFGLPNWNVLAARIQPAAEGAPALHRAIPLLRIFSVEKAYEFYLDYLGFTLEWEHRFAPDLPLYAQITRSGLALHLTEHHGDASPGSKVFIVMTGIAAFHRELSAKRYRYARPGLEEAPWGARILQVADPFGNRLLFNEYHKRSIGEGETAHVG